MRIVITKKGRSLIKEIEEEKSEMDIKTKKGLIYTPRLPKLSNIKTIKEKLLKASKTFYPSSEIKLLKKKKSISMMNEYFNRDESKVDKKELKQAKKIVVSKSKIQMNQRFLEKYHNLDFSFKEKLDNLSNMLNAHKDNNQKNEDEDSNISLGPHTIRVMKSNYGEKMNLFNKTVNSFRKIKKIKIGDIISKSNLNQLKSYIVKDNEGHKDARVPLDKNNTNSYNFRTKYENKKLIKENLKSILNKTINTDRTDLISYLKRNKSIAPYYLKNLLKYDEYHIYKLNKMCGFLMNKEKNKIFSERKNHKNIKNKIFDRSSNGLIFLLDKTNKILNEYSEYKDCKNKIIKQKYKEMIKNIKKDFWDKFHVEKLINKNYNQDDSKDDY